MKFAEKRQSIHVAMIGIAQIMSTRSTCQRRKVGAVITNKKNQILSTGYNGVPAGWTHCTQIPCAGAGQASGQNLDLCEAVHAEANAVVQCGNINEAYNIYVTTLCCVSCIKLLLNTPIKDIYYTEDYAQGAATKEYWLKNDRRLIHVKGPIMNLSNA